MLKLQRRSGFCRRCESLYGNSTLVVDAHDDGCPLLSLIIKIKTVYDPAPFPTRSSDWCAYVDGYEERGELYGYGRTEKLALQDCVDSIEENVEVVT
jgi:hypothetical protein